MKKFRKLLNLTLASTFVWGAMYEPLLVVKASAESKGLAPFLAEYEDKIIELTPEESMNWNPNEDELMKDNTEIEIPYFIQGQSKGTEEMKVLSSEEFNIVQTLPEEEQKKYLSEFYDYKGEVNIPQAYLKTVNSTCGYEGDSWNEAIYDPTNLKITGFNASAMAKAWKCSPLGLMPYTNFAIDGGKFAGTLQWRIGLVATVLNGIFEFSSSAHSWNFASAIEQQLREGAYYNTYKSQIAMIEANVRYYLEDLKAIENNNFSFSFPIPEGFVGLVWKEVLDSTHNTVTTEGYTGEDYFSVYTPAVLVNDRFVQPVNTPNYPWTYRWHVKYYGTSQAISVFPTLRFGGAVYYEKPGTYSYEEYEVISNSLEDSSGNKKYNLYYKNLINGNLISAAFQGDFKKFHNLNNGTRINLYQFSNTGQVNFDSPRVYTSNVYYRLIGRFLEEDAILNYEDRGGTRWLEDGTEKTSSYGPIISYELSNSTGTSYTKYHYPLMVNTAKLRPKEEIWESFTDSNAGKSFQISFKDIQWQRLNPDTNIEGPDCSGGTCEVLPPVDGGGGGFDDGSSGGGGNGDGDYEVPTPPTENVMGPLFEALTDVVPSMIKQLVWIVINSVILIISVVGYVVTLPYVPAQTSLFPPMFVKGVQWYQNFTIGKVTKIPTALAQKLGTNSLIPEGTFIYELKISDIVNWMFLFLFFLQLVRVVMGRKGPLRVFDSATDLGYNVLKGAVEEERREQEEQYRAMETFNKQLEREQEAQRRAVEREIEARNRRAEREMDNLHYQALKEDRVREARAYAREKAVAEAEAKKGGDE